MFSRLYSPRPTGPTTIRTHMHTCAPVRPEELAKKREINKESDDGSTNGGCFRQIHCNGPKYKLRAHERRHGRQIHEHEHAYEPKHEHTDTYNIHMFL